MTSSRKGTEGEKVPWSPRADLEFNIMSPRAPHRECCPYLFQRGMVVSEEGVRGAQDHLRCEEVGEPLECHVFLEMSICIMFKYLNESIHCL